MTPPRPVADFSGSPTSGPMPVAFSDLFCNPVVLERIATQVQKRLADARRRRTEEKSAESRLKAELAEVEQEISRLVDWIAKGKLVGDLEQKMAAAEVRRDYLRRELAANGDVGDLFRYDQSGDLYIFNLSTRDPAYYTYYSYEARVILDNGQTHSVSFNLK